MAADPGLAGTSTSRCRNAEHERVAARRLERLAHVINPGGWAVESARPIATLLGSCVAVCLYDTRLRLAGMNHFLLPGGTRRHVDGDEIVLQGDYAMEVLRNAMFARGAHPSRLVAKAFGGGNVVSGIHTAIGTRNAEFARQWLQREHIPLLASDLGGARLRKIVFDPCTGDVFCRRSAIRTPEAIAIAQAEIAYERALLKRNRSGATSPQLFRSSVSITSASTVNALGISASGTPA